MKKTADYLSDLGWSMLGGFVTFSAVARDALRPSNQPEDIEKARKRVLELEEECQKLRSELALEKKARDELKKSYYEVALIAAETWYKKKGHF
jgi:cell division protein FtsB